MIREFADRLCNEQFGKWRNPGKEIGVYTWNNSVGHGSFKVAPYEVTWEARCNISLPNSFIKIIHFYGERSISFNDKYYFDEKIEKGMQYFSDTLPSYIAGSGTPFTIYGTFSDLVSGFFTINCRNS